MGKDGNLLLWPEAEKSNAKGYYRLPEKLRMNEVMPLDQSRLLFLPGGEQPEWVDLKNDSPPLSLPGPTVSSNVLSFFGTNILCRWNGSNQFLIHEWHGTTFVQQGFLSLSSGKRPNEFAYSPARQLLAWTEGTSSTSVYLASPSAPERQTELKGDMPWLISLRFSDNGNYLTANAAHDHSLRAWNTETGLRVASLDERVRAVAFAAGGRVLMAAIEHGSDHEIVFFDLEHPGNSPRRVLGKGFTASLAVSPDGTLAAAATTAGEVRLFDALKGEFLDSIHGHLNGVSGVAFSPDGRRLISTSGGREALKLWDVGTRQELLTFGGTGSLLQAARWSVDGDVIIAGTPWQAWHAPSWAEIAAAEAKTASQ